MQKVADIISCYEFASGQRINKDKLEVVFSENMRPDQDNPFWLNCG